MKQLLVLLLGLSILSGCGEDRIAGIENSGDPPFPYQLDLPSQGALGVTFMTWNLYLGADLNPIIGAQDPSQIPGLVAQTWAMIQATNFPERALTLAEEIGNVEPHLVGLQEVALYRFQSPGDAAYGGQEPATDVVFDFLQLLLDALADEGYDYFAVVAQDETDVELPSFAGFDPNTGQPLFDDVRMTLRDVILARWDVQTSSPMSANYQAAIPISPQINILRGWTSVVATLRGTTLRFANTHLEVPSFEPIQVAQASELLDILDGETLPVVLVGDFNSDAILYTTPTYDMVTGSGYVDAWSEHRGHHPGLTSSQGEDLMNEESMLHQRIDHVFVRGLDKNHAGILGGVHADIFGEEQEDRTPSGLWPSDHAGMAVILKTPPAQPASFFGQE